MLEVKGDLWSFESTGPAVRCITTNATVKKNGTCVMGRGCAREAAMKWPALPKMLGDHLRAHGNVPA